jgi:DNA polymerase I-like protein with 3'-5' exonuclease and polymerase domains
MLKIKRHKISRTINADEFRKMKNAEPFATMRQDSKSINFGFLFGASAKTFVEETLEVSWDEKKLDEYIETNKLEALKDEIIQRYQRETPLKWKYLTCATDIRNKFFEAYPGLMERIERERQFAIRHGYIRAHHGAVRRTPELFLMSTDDRGKDKGLDRSYYGKLIHTLSNVAANTAIQNFEAVLVMGAITELVEFIQRKGLKSFIWNYVHDSIDFVLHRDEIDLLLAKAVQVCREPHKELLGVPMDVDIVVADELEGDIYKGGKSMNIESLLSRVPAEQLQ